jgi:limonene-1,2-epoxide hydrolase
MTDALFRARDATVRAHVAAEERGDWDAALRTFARPRYEIVATGEIHEGERAVDGFYDESKRAFGAMRFETKGVHHAGSVVFHEVVFRAKHVGPWRGLWATDREVEYAMLNLFEFEEDRLVCERMYFDLGTPLRQIGIARDPTSLAGRLEIGLCHPLTVGTAFVRSLGRR